MFGVDRLIIHLLRNGGDIVLSVLPNLLSVVIAKLASTKHNTAFEVSVADPHRSLTSLTPFCFRRNGSRPSFYPAHLRYKHKERVPSQYSLLCLSTHPRDRPLPFKFFYAHGSRIQTSSLDLGLPESGMSSPSVDPITQTF